MKKSLKKYLWSWTVVGVLSVVFIVLSKTVGFAPHHKLAQDPANIEKITKLDLPDIISVESSDNLDRGQSCWDCFIHLSRFEGKLSDDCVRQLESLCVSDTVHWRKNTTSPLPPSATATTSASTPPSNSNHKQDSHQFLGLLFNPSKRNVGASMNCFVMISESHISGILCLTNKL